MEAKTFNVGDQIRYNCVNLWSYRGKIVDLEKSSGGGDCHVYWWSPAWFIGKSAECQCNLLKVEEV